MSPPQTPKRGGAAPMLFLFCAVAGGAGLAFDLMLSPDHGFWLGAQPGARAVIGAGAAALVILAGHLARWALSRRGEGARDAGGHP